MKMLTRSELEDYITGASILGCGGGGTVAGGRAMVADAFGKGFEFKLADLNELPDDEFLCILGWVGGGVPKEVMERLAPYFEKLKGSDEETMLGLQRASEALSGEIGRKFCAYIATETGPENGIMPMYMSALEGKPCVDADCCGRSKPEIALSLTNVAGISTTPLSIVTPFGETLILKSAVDDQRAEDLCRYASAASGGRIYVARCPAKVETYRKGMVPNQVTRCIKIGEAIGTARSKSQNPVEALIREANARKLFEGTVVSHEVEGRGGFNWGNWNIDGSGDSAGHSFRVWFKNEHLISWLDGAPCVVCPDLICIVDSETCEGLSNFVASGENDGREVTVLGFQAYEAWRTKRGIEVFGPRHFGCDIEYKWPFS